MSKKKETPVDGTEQNKVNPEAGNTGTDNTGQGAGADNTGSDETAQGGDDTGQDTGTAGAATNGKNPKTETKPKDKPETVANATAAKVGKGVLKANPNLKAVYVTTDGGCFYEECDAASHARSLKDKTVTEVKRETAE